MLEKFTPRQIISATLVVTGVAAAFWLLYSFHLAFILLFIAAFLGTAIRPLVEWLFQRGLPRAWGVLLIFLLIVGAVALIGLLLAPLLIEQSAELAIRLPNIYQEYRLELLTSPSRLVRLIAYQLPPINFLDAPPVDAGEVNPIDQVNDLLAFTRQVIVNLLSLLAVFLLTYYWTLESERSIRGMLLWVPSQTRPELRALITEIEDKIGGFVRGQAILCLAIGAAALAAYILLGLPYALVLALLAGLLEAVPVVGPFLGAIPAILIALSIDNQLVVGVVIATIFIQVLENYILVPRIMKKAVGVNPIVALLALITLTSVLGLVGALLAIPIAAILQLLVRRYLLNRPLVSTDSIPERDYASLLHYQLQEFNQDIRKVLRGKNKDADGINDELEDELEKLANQMDALLTRKQTPEDAA